MTIHRKKISRITLEGTKREKQLARETLARMYDVSTKILEIPWFNNAVTQVELRVIDARIKRREDITLEEAFSGMCVVLTATNNYFFQEMAETFASVNGGEWTSERALAGATAFLQGMAMKEALQGLIPEEVAGLAAAATIDTIVQFPLPKAVETCGMGGDRGIIHNGRVKKTINASTLSALVLAACGLPVIKHGSYANTSATGSTDMLESFGAMTTMESREGMMDIWEKCGFVYLDAHLVKTVHDLSHLLMMETINHIVGPMSLPVARSTEITKIMGVNEKVHPEVIARAYTILNERNIQSVGAVAVVAGLGEHKGAKNVHVILDEMSPYASLVAFSFGSQFLGTFTLYPEDFGAKLNPEAVFVENEKKHIHEANKSALMGEDKALAEYLAMNAGLGLFVWRYLGKDGAITKTGPRPELLKGCFQECRNAIFSGAAWTVLENYIRESNRVIRR